MRKRYLVLGLSAFLALALAVPALGGPSNPVADISATAKKTAKKALKKAKKAQTAANDAQSTANQAVNDAGDASTAAAAAQTSADNAQAAADAAQATADTKFGNTVSVTGTATANNGTTPKLTSAACAGDNQVTGGGYIIGGTDNSDEAVVLEFAYSDDWIVQAQEIDGTTPGNWSLAATAVCATTG
jgi:cytoskeletal protein RodZ